MRLTSGAEVSARFVSTIELKRAQLKIPDPAVPRSYIKSQDRWEENPWDPAYTAAKRRVAAQRAEFTAIEVIRIGCRLESAVPKDEKWLRRLRRYNIATELVNNTNLDNPEELAFLYLVTECVRTAEDMGRIIDATVITEEEVTDFVRMMGVQRGGMPIDQAPTRNQVDTGIQASVIAIGSRVLVSPIDEYDACTNAGMSWVSWRQGAYPKELMVEAIGMNRLSALVDTHKQDAAHTAASKKEQREMTTTQLELDNGIVVNVTRMADHDLLRAASIFDPEKAERISENSDSASAMELIDIWRGNEKYLMFIVESACELVSPLPKDDTWLRRYRRHADLYQIAVEDLVYLEYIEAVYIRYLGMTNDDFVSAVTSVAMGSAEREEQEQSSPRQRKSRLAQLTKNEG